MKIKLSLAMIYFCTIMAAIAILAACAAPVPAEPAPAAAAEPATAREATTMSADGLCESYNEAPELAERVATGDLPAVAERLPVHPVVDPVFEGIGQYGGTLYDLYDGVRLAEFRQYGYEGLVRWSVDGNEVIPNIAERWEVSEDGTTYTFFLREGLRWSDGEPFTADDILFWWNEVETNTAI